MQKRKVWLWAPVLVLAFSVTAFFSLNVAGAMTGSAVSAEFDDGTLIRSSFAVGRGLNLDGSQDEITADYWIKVGAYDEEEQLKVTLTDSSGVITQEGIRRRTDEKATTYIGETGEVIETERPANLSVVMWDEDSVTAELLGRGFQVAGTTEIAGLSAQIYELRSDHHHHHDEPSESLFKRMGVDAHDVTDIVRRVFIGTEPFGIDLGEEAGYVMADGSEFIPYYRRISAWEVFISEEPAGLFEWSPSVAGEVIR